MDTIAIAACAFELPKDGQPWLQVMPAGAFKPNDRRDMPSGHWYIDCALAKDVISKFKAQKTPPAIDYEHQTQRSAQNGQPAPAAGFIVDLEWREGSGLWAKADYTPIAKEQIKNGQYRYFSPVFEHDKKGNVKALLMGAFTNNPAIDGMAALQYASRLNPFIQEEPAMTDNTADKPKEADLSAIASALQLDKSADEQTILAACAKLQSKAHEAAKEPDPAKYVSVATMQQMQGEIAALSAQIQANEANTLINEALKEGKLLPAQKEWATAYATKDLQGFKGYLQSAAPIAALTKLQGKEPPATHAHGLCSAELKIAKATNIDPEAFAKAKAAKNELIEQLKKESE